MINLNKGISTLLALTIIIVLGVLVGGGILVYQYYYLSKQETEISKQIETPKDETADWKTYKNEEYGFEIKYPNSWTIQKGESFSFFDDRQNQIIEIIKWTGYIVVEDLDVQVIRPIIDIVLGTKKEFQYNNIKILTWDVERDRRVAFVTKNEEYPEITYFINYINNYEDGLSIFDQMLSTFKFID